MNGYSTLVEQTQKKILSYISTHPDTKQLPKENEFADILGVSRGVLRESLSQLRALGIIETKRKKGTVVVSPNVFGVLKPLMGTGLLDKKSLKDLYQLRLMLEIGAADFIFMGKNDRFIEELDAIVGQEADLDQALIDTYARAGITNDPLTHTSTPPTIINLFDTLLHMGGTGPSLAQRLRKYTTGTFAGIFSQQSNIDINNQMVVFNIRDLEDELRPVAMYIVLSHIWNITRANQKKRLLLVDEAWQLMKYEDSANFLFSLAKRARKYYLGLTTITQDVEDFMSSKMGRAIVANSSMQLLLKQSASAVDVLSDVFKLTDEERKRLSNFPVGQGLFFAGQNHVHIQIVASETEESLITTNPNARK